MRNGRAAVFTLLLVSLFSILSLWATDWPVLGRASANLQNRRAVLVVRDDMGSSLKWASRSFTMPALERNYDAVRYFTQSYEGDQIEAFQEALEEALAEYDQVDLFFLRVDESLLNWVSWADRERTEKIRFVYNAAGGGVEEGEQWLDLGADAYLGHPDGSFSPPFFFYFLRRWSAGMELEKALVGANARTRRHFRRLRVLSLCAWDTSTIAEVSQGMLFGEGGLTIGG